MSKVFIYLCVGTRLYTRQYPQHGVDRIEQSLSIQRVHMTQIIWQIVLWLDINLVLTNFYILLRHGVCAEWNVEKLKVQLSTLLSALWQHLWVTCGHCSYSSVWSYKCYFNCVVRFATPQAMGGVVALVRNEVFVLSDPVCYKLCDWEEVRVWLPWVRAFGAWAVREDWWGWDRAAGWVGGARALRGGGVRV